ncbi:hypothetical protein HYH02_002689 [Chlamydomonas schloesseri]|uniref:Uncharacterized protein n=1 Tax=Chlamydomonas schloesseri TaxID=2026947 RepID=A0A835WS41_9CHLO|nr:hypothetical protein HYH02_002689 [Chlamydomonas schloesseri]|eukprot:KAG2452447.1 hypothetical protein HYH02_002689 [Chlamydomonas schloesseri]
MSTHKPAIPVDWTRAEESFRVARCASTEPSEYASTISPGRFARHGLHQGPHPSLRDEGGPARMLPGTSSSSLNPPLSFLHNSYASTHGSARWDAKDAPGPPAAVAPGPSAGSQHPQPTHGQHHEAWAPRPPSGLQQPSPPRQQPQPPSASPAVGGSGSTSTSTSYCSSLLPSRMTGTDLARAALGRLATAEQTLRDVTTPVSSPGAGGATVGALGAGGGVGSAGRFHAHRLTVNPGSPGAHGGAGAGAGSIRVAFASCASPTAGGSPGAGAPTGLPPRPPPAPLGALSPAADPHTASPGRVPLQPGSPARERRHLMGGGAHFAVPPPVSEAPDVACLDAVAADAEACSGVEGGEGGAGESGSPQRLGAGRSPNARSGWGRLAARSGGGGGHQPSGSTFTSFSDRHQQSAAGSGSMKQRAVGAGSMKSRQAAIGAGGWGVVGMAAGQQPAPGQHLQRGGSIHASAAGGGGGGGASAAATAMALRMVQGLQERDEFSLVAAARQRQLRINTPGPLDGRRTASPSLMMMRRQQHQQQQQAQLQPQAQPQTQPLSSGGAPLAGAADQQLQLQQLPSLLAQQRQASLTAPESPEHGLDGVVDIFRSQPIPSASLLLDSPGTSRPASFTCSGANPQQRPGGAYIDDRALSCPGISLDLGLAPGVTVMAAAQDADDNGIEVLGPVAAALEVAAALAARPREEAAAAAAAEAVQVPNPNIILRSHPELGGSFTGATASPGRGAGLRPSGPVVMYSPQASMSGSSGAVMALAQAYASTGATAGGSGGGGGGGGGLSRASRISAGALGSGPNEFYSTTSFTGGASTGTVGATGGMGMGMGMGMGSSSVSASGEAVARASASFGASGSRASASGRFSSPPPQLRLGLGLGLAGAAAAAAGAGAGAAVPPAAHSGGATAREAAAALAAVRALEGRYGSAVAPDEELLALEQEAAFRDRSVRMQDALQAANPAAYSEEAAEAAEAAYRALAERAKLRLRRLLAEPTTDQAAARQLQNAVMELGSFRPFFLPPVLERTKMERAPLEHRREEKRWLLDESIFAARRKENEARDYFDSEKVRKAQLRLDWERIACKTRFRKMVARSDLGVKNDGQRLEEELGEVRQELEKHAGLIRSAFIYYSAANGALTSTNILQMGANVWLNFCNDAGIVHPTQRGCTVQDLQTIFISVNFEEESETAEAEANDDDAMMRFEFMEGIVRAAFGKYIESKRCSDSSDAVAMMLADILAAPDLPPEAQVDPDVFRRTRFYTPGVEAVLKEYYDLLLGMYKLYKARDRAKLFWPEHWAAFLDSNKLLGLATGVERHESKIIYCWSQALVADELRRRQRAVSLTFWDFVEAVARLADLISPPGHEDIAAYFKTKGDVAPQPDRLVYEYYRHVGDAGTDRKRASAELVASPSRPLEVKLRLLLEYLVVSLREAWGGKDAKDVATKVLKMAHYLSGGIEMH